MKHWLMNSDYKSGDSGANVGKRMQDMVVSLNLDHFSFAILRPPENVYFDINDTIKTSYPAEWLNRYTTRRYVEVDPVTKLAGEMIRPFFWGQGRFLRSFKKPQRRVFDEARAFQITYGLAIPMRGTDGDLSIFNVVSSNKQHLQEVAKHESGRIFAAAYDTHDHVLDEQKQRMQFRDNLIELTIRECECLAWTLEGKTAGEIATILGLSVSTINHHASTASRKLGSLNKHHAAIKALRQGLIQ